MTIESSKSTGSYAAYLVPVNVNKSFKTTEFETNFKTDTKVTFNDKSFSAHYLTGKKLIGDGICSNETNLKPFLIKKEENTSNTETISIAKPITDLILMEREGNEYSLIDEVNKFGEFVTLMNTIHG